ncbi:MAG: retropepsin-like aspartic protease [Chloroflexota bacterium]|nr:retropepsin-like aspartic protease [Chloroflexota bacterium]
MSKIPFDPDAAILLFECGLEFKSRHIFILALDTGSSYTIISEAAAIQVGFDPGQVTETASFGDASQHHIAPKVTLKSFALANAKVDNLDVLIYTLPEEHGIDGVIGLNFLRQFNIGLDFKQGILTLNP